MDVCYAAPIGLDAGDSFLNVLKYSSEKLFLQKSETETHSRAYSMTNIKQNL